MTKQYHFSIENAKGKTASFRGDGDGLMSAFKEGITNAIEHGGLKVSAEEFKPVLMTLKEFEDGSIAVVETPEEF